jgi:hypothetical protein
MINVTDNAAAQILKLIDKPGTRSATDVSASAAMIRSLTCHSGSRMLHFEYCSQLWFVSEQAVTVSGPSID